MTGFSNQLADFLQQHQQITIGDLIAEFSEKSYALLFLLLMAAPALPLPTGGVTHIFEIIVCLLAIELMIGRKNIWLPSKWAHRTLPKGLQNAALPKFLGLLRWFEKHSRRRFERLIRRGVTARVIGLMVFIFTIFAFLAPPFSGLDTLPSLGVVMLSLALIFEDAILMLVGTLIGFTGIIILLLFGKVVVNLFT